MLISVVQQSQSAICIHISLPLGPPSWATPCPISPLQVITENQAELPELYTRGPLAIYLTPGNVYMSVLISQFIPSFPTHLFVHMSFLYSCISIPALQIGSVVPFFQIPHICINMQCLITLQNTQIVHATQYENNKQPNQKNEWKT